MGLGRPSDELVASIAGHCSDRLSCIEVTVQNNTLVFYLFIFALFSSKARRAERPLRSKSESTQCDTVTNGRKRQ